jgi:RNA polymerase sigma-70 factor (ECF subfamily)
MALVDRVGKEERVDENGAQKRERLEKQVRESWKSEDFDQATSLCIKGLGPEIIGFLDARLHSLADAEEVFCLFAEDLWRGLPKFEWRSSVRVWAYSLAINATNRYVSAPHRKRNRNLALSRIEYLQKAVDRVRTTTVAYLKTQTKTRMQALREMLPAEDQTLLILRVDRGMSWRELAMAMGVEEESSSDEAVTRNAARLRKRFERIKLRLRELAVQEGVIDEC